jgi:ring-1,2-phenylacetyl-CoA epoxidase subunit PaaE
MLETTRAALLAVGMDANTIQVERYGAPRKKPAAAMPEAPVDKHTCRVTVIMDGHNKSFRMPAEGMNIVDAAAAKGITLPYSCKGGVCATCRTHLREGKVRMETNYGLEPWEVEQGFVLACQSHPQTDEVTLDYDRI